MASSDRTCDTEDCEEEAEYFEGQVVRGQEGKAWRTKRKEGGLALCEGCLEDRIGIEVQKV